MGRGCLVAVAAAALLVIFVVGVFALAWIHDPSIEESDLYGTWEGPGLAFESNETITLMEDGSYHREFVWGGEVQVNRGRWSWNGDIGDFVLDECLHVISPGGDEQLAIGSCNYHPSREFWLGQELFVGEGGQGSLRKK